MGSLASALEQAARKHGAEIRLNAPVSKILSERGKVQGVVLGDGEELRAALIVSAIHPVATLRNLVAPGEVDTHLSMSLKHVRSKGDAANPPWAGDGFAAAMRPPARCLLNGVPFPDWPPAYR